VTSTNNSLEPQPAGAAADDGSAARQAGAEPGSLMKMARRAVGVVVGPRPWPGRPPSFRRDDQPTLPLTRCPPVPHM